LPISPGIYYFEGKDKKPLYIGKSINIRSRIRQHLEQGKDQTTKAALYVNQTHTLYYQTVGSDIEAIILESSLIKLHQPKYNSQSKDDKTQTYIIFTNPPESKIKILHTTDIREFDLENLSTQVYGPYQSGRTAQLLVKTIRQTFGYCQYGGPRSRSCFYLHLGQCPGICANKITDRQYTAHLSKIKKFLSGQFTDILRTHNRLIKKLIKAQDFEQAEQVKQIITHINQILSSRDYHRLLELADNPAQSLIRLVRDLGYYRLTRPPMRIECYDLAHNQGQAYVGSMSVMNRGILDTSQYRHFNLNLDKSSDAQAMQHIISRRLTHTDWPTPDLILLDGGLPQLSVVTKVLNTKIPIIALAKKKETIYYYDIDNQVTELVLPLSHPGLSLLRLIRDEAHRFANSFHRRQISSILKS
jgi:excinuclease ABC subunit C